MLLSYHAATADYQLLFDEDYNANQIPPVHEDTPLVIKVSINLRNILEVAEKEQLISLETTLRLYWKVIMQLFCPVTVDLNLWVFLSNILYFKDGRVKPKQKYLKSYDSFGPYVTLNPSHAGRFWMPDIFIDQAKALRVPAFYTRPASLRVYNDSTIRYSSRYTADQYKHFLVTCIVYKKI